MACSDVTDIPSPTRNHGIHESPSITDPPLPDTPSSYQPHVAVNTFKEGQPPSSSSSIASESSATSNGLRPGIYVPTLAFFNPEKEDLDPETATKHSIRMAQAGITGFIVHGTIGEVAHLSRPERKVLTKATRAALDSEGYNHIPIIVGCNAQSTRETVELCFEAQSSGAGYALVLPPFYYKEQCKSECLKEFFTDVADASPIPVLVYSFLDITAGIDIDSDMMADLGQNHPNIVGCKLTCADTGKLNRIVSVVNRPPETEQKDCYQYGFLCLGGSADFLIQVLAGGGSGAVCGLANITPKACVKLFDLWRNGKFQEASSLQAAVARGDWLVTKSGIVGMKSLLQHFFGYGGFARKPLPRLSKQEEIVLREKFQELINIESRLQ
jgi:dihydrodipicolinate synthase/N-acetylneuraminate lyase